MGGELYCRGTFSPVKWNNTANFLVLFYGIGVREGALALMVIMTDLLPKLNSFSNEKSKFDTASCAVIDNITFLFGVTLTWHSSALSTY